MLCVGNIDAIAAGKRFIDADLNRMFRAERGALAGTAEAARADEMIAATAAFFDGGGTAALAPGPAHGDPRLRSIRPSRSCRT